MVYIKASGAGTNTGWTEVATGGGMPQWTQSGTVIHPNTMSDDVAIGGTTAANANIFFNDTAQTVFNEQGNPVSFRVEGDTNQNLLVVNGTIDSIGIGTSAPATSTILDLSASDRALRVTRLSDPVTDLPNRVTV